MKTKQVLLTAFVASFFLFSSCTKEDDKLQESGMTSQESALAESSSSLKSSSIDNEFPQAKQEVIETFGAIAQSIIDGDIDKLISFHAYGPKFTEFKDGAPRNGGAENEAYERALFGSVTEVVKFAADDLKVAVYYGNVANLTFHSDFQLMFGEDLVVVNNQITLLFVKTNGQWKLVHEHHSPLV